MATNFAGSLKTESFAKGLLLVVVTAILTVINCFLSNREWDSVKAYFVPADCFCQEHFRFCQLRSGFCWYLSAEIIIIILLLPPDYYNKIFGYSSVTN